MSGVFDYIAQGTAPGHISVGMRNGLVVLTVRGDPTITIAENPVDGWHQVVTPGDVATFSVPASAAALMALAILRAVMVPDQDQPAFPYVLFFESDEARTEYATKINGENPDIMEVGMASG